MKLFLGLMLSLAALPGSAQEQEIQRALIQRDQQSAEFAAGVRGSDVARLQHFHALQLRDAGRPLHPDPEIARQLQPYERQKLADERELRLPPPVVLTKSGSDPDLRPLPLPGGPRHGVDPIPAQGLGH
jgi:hypothetical protein